MKFPINLLVLKDKHTTFTVRLVQEGQYYGRFFSIKHRMEDPLVEFYDTRTEECMLGQLVSRYTKSALLDYRQDGLCLDGGVKEWSIHYRENMEKLYHWLESLE